MVLIPEEMLARAAGSGNQRDTGLKDMAATGISEIKAVVFDYGNTLIEFGPRQVAEQHAALRNALTGIFGECDTDRLKAVRDKQMIAPYMRGYTENKLEDLCAELVVEMYGTEPEEHLVRRLVETRYTSFLESITLPDGVMETLAGLREHFRLGFLSNYPCGRSILDSLDRIGLAPMFETALVSGDIGYAKPHPRPFQAVLEKMDLPAEECVYVGDNWLADIQGAKGVGMKAVLTTQYEAYADIAPQPGDHQPDASIDHLNELESVLASC